MYMGFGYLLSSLGDVCLLCRHLRIKPLALSNLSSVKTTHIEEDKVLKPAVISKLKDNKSNKRPYAKFIYLDDTIEILIYPESTYGDDHIRFVDKLHDPMPVKKQAEELSSLVQFPQLHLQDSEAHPQFGDIVILLAPLSPAISRKGEETFVYFHLGDNFVDPRYGILISRILACIFQVQCMFTACECPILKKL